jgi:hypothetical protein
MPLHPSHLRMSPLLALTLAAALMLPLAFSSARAQSPHGGSVTSTTESAPVLEAVQRYFLAADSGNADAVRGAFWPSGRVEGVGNGRFLSWTADDFATRNFRGQPNTSRELTRTIEWLDISGTGAVARVKVSIGADTTYWDYFVLHKLGGEWKIGLKAFANPERPA